MSASVQAGYLYPFTALFTVNLKESLFTKRIIIPFLIFAIPVVLLFLWRVIYMLAPLPPGSPLSDPFLQYETITKLFLAYIIIPLIALMRGSALLSEEWQTGTMLLLQIRPVPRWVITAGKLASFIIYGLILLSFSLVASFLIAASFPDSGMFPGDLTYLLKDIQIFTLALAVYGSLLMLIGIYFTRPMMAGIVLLLWDLFGSYLPGNAHRLTVRYYLQSIAPEIKQNVSVFDSFVALTPASTTVSVLVLMGIIVICVLLSSFILSRKTIQPESAQ